MMSLACPEMILLFPWMMLVTNWETFSLGTALASSP